MLFVLGQSRVYPTKKAIYPPYPVRFHNLQDVRRKDNPAHYPGQSWSNFISGTMFDFTQWNTYTVEWDSTEVNTYFNHVLIDRLPKYYYKQRVGTFSIRVNPGCNADTTYQVTRAFLTVKIQVASCGLQQG